MKLTSDSLTNIYFTILLLAAIRAIALQNCIRRKQIDGKKENLTIHNVTYTKLIQSTLTICELDL